MQVDVTVVKCCYISQTWFVVPRIYKLRFQALCSDGGSVTSLAATALPRVYFGSCTKICK